MLLLTRLSLITIVFTIILSESQKVSAHHRPPLQQETPKTVPNNSADCDPDGVQTSGAVYRICMPPLSAWKGDLVVYAHGYVSPTEPVGIPESQMVLPDGTPIADVVNFLGFAFVTTSYSTNGLAVREGIDDLVDVVDIFEAQIGTPNRVYLLGISEGGLISTLAVEQHPKVFDGALAMCGPYGDFSDQINYFGDLRVVFDYFFPGLMPDSPINIPLSLMNQWDSHFQTVIKPALEDSANTSLVDQLLTVTDAPTDPTDPGTKVDTIEDVLWYNVFATNDANVKLTGQPFDNQNRLYEGSNDDSQLNTGVLRFTADQIALDQIATYYETSGNLSIPLVTLHTTGDPVIPYWHTTRYHNKIMASGSTRFYEHIGVDRYGHCSFTPVEVLNAFNRLVELVNRPIQLFLPLISKTP